MKGSVRSSVLDFRVRHETHEEGSHSWLGLHVSLTAPLQRSKTSPTRPAVGHVSYLWRRDPGGWAVLRPATKWLRYLSNHMLYPDSTFKSVLLASSQPFSFRCYNAVAEGQLHWENRNFISAENLKLTTARKPTPSLRIVVVYSRLNQGQ